MSGTPASMGCCSRVQPCVHTPRRRDGNGHSEDSSQWQTLECFHTLLFIYLPCKVEPSVIKICVCTWKIFMKYLNAYLHLNYQLSNNLYVFRAKYKQLTFLLLSHLWFSKTLIPYATKFWWKGWYTYQLSLNNPDQNLVPEFSPQAEEAKSGNKASLCKLVALSPLVLTYI